MDSSIFDIVGRPSLQEATVIARFIITFLISLPILIGVGIYQTNRNRTRHITVTFSGPDGTIRRAQIKIGISWTIYFFGGWALLFRNQFKEWIILFFSSIALTVSIRYISNLSNLENLGKLARLAISSSLLLAFTLLKDYYILIGNRLRLQSLNKRGYSFDNGLNEDVKGIYEYIKVPQGETAQYMSKDEMKPLKENEVQGERHKYVVPEKKETNEDDNDYSNLTSQDLKLLLRSDGIPFDSTSTKEELLEIVNKNIKPKKIDEEHDNDYSNLTSQDLKLLLRSDGIPFDPSFTKEELLEVVNENLNSKEKPKQEKESKPKKEPKQEKELKDLSMQELKLYLKKEEIDFKPSLRKEELLKLAEKNKKKK